MHSEADSALQKYIEALPQKPPFLFVDDLELVEHLERAVGSVTFHAGHPVFENHLPDEPLVPGVILIEALAQLSGIVMMPPGGRLAKGYLAAVRNIRFRRLVRPGERVTISSRHVRKLGTAASFEVSAEVDGTLAVSGQLTVGGMT